jgi:hypothetical protein
MLPGATCPQVHDYAHRGGGPKDVDTWHGTTGAITYPPRANGWLARTGGRRVTQR